jgi:hypothetical protein
MNFFSNAHAYSAWTRYNKEGEGGGGGKGSLEKCNEHNNHLVNVFLFTFFSSFVLTGFMTYIL